MKIRVLGLLLLTIPVLAAGQISGSFSGPSLGFVLDDTGGYVRPLLGISGSATVGASIDVGLALTSVIALPDQRNILAVPESGKFLLAIDMGVSPPSARPITGTAGYAEIRLSPNGKTAALAYPNSQRIQVITGMPEQPVVSLEISTAEVPATLQRVAANDAGDLLLMSFLGDDHETIYRWNSTEGYRLLASVGRVGALGFVGSADAVFADRVTGEVFFAQDVRSGSVTQFIAGPDEGVSDPVAIAVSRAGGFFLANRSSRTVMTFSASHRMVKIQECNCEVSGLYPLSAGIFRITQGLNQTIYLLDDTKSEARLVFVPPLQ